MKNRFEVAGGSVTGRDHLRTARNNQDAYGWQIEAAGTIAVICDGCGSGAHSEVGAQLGARLILATLQQLWQTGWDWAEAEVWQVLQQRILGELQRIAEPLGGDRFQAVRDYLLFTIVGTVITPSRTSIFALGDGVIAINGEVVQLGPFANNAPPYLAYGLWENSIAPVMPLALVRTLPTDQVHTLLLGSDGIQDLLQVADQPVPGRSDLVGDLAQFWKDDRYFRNPDQVRRRLTLINREVITLDPQTHTTLRQPGLLPDDTTLIVIRRCS